MELQTSGSGHPFDIHAICRLCLSDKNDSLKSVFDEILAPSRLPQKIELLLQVQVSKYDKLSTMVCNDCIIRLDTWFAYKKQCHKNQTKLAEWLNISKTNGAELHETVLNIKSESLEPFESGLPVKVEVTYDNDEYTSANTSAYQYEDDVDLSEIETDDDRRCPDCGKMFGNSQNRRRHQNMMHMKKERRFQMAEIKRPSNCTTPVENDKQVEVNSKPVLMEVDRSVDSTQKEKPEQIIEEIKVKINASCDTIKQPKDEADSGITADVLDTNNIILSEDRKPDVSSTHEVQSMEASADSSTVDEKPPPVLENNVTEREKNHFDQENQSEEKPIKFEEDEKKIEFAAGLKLIQKESTTQNDNYCLSKIEISYIEKCKAMVSMFHTLQCACHDVQHKTLRNLLAHLRETRLWFPLFTCYNCMISLTDRSTFTKHHSRCPHPQLEALKKLSNLRKRTQIKSRLYQNFKCNRCKFLFSFHEDFCKHVDENHAHGAPPFYCSCRFVFDSLEEYKNHCYTSCTISYYCDICFATTPTVEEFIKHSQECHDNSEGFVLLQENTYVPRTQAFRHKEADDESNVLEGKRERRKSAKEPIVVQIYDKEIPPDVRDIPTSVIRRMLEKEAGINLSNNKSAAKCPLCKKQYSSVNNMMRHYRSHIENKEVEIPKIGDDTENEDLYTCPDCGGVYPASKWQDHLQEKHSTKACSECDKEFEFQSELDQHRSVHLNIKVFRDSKTQVYRSAMLSPTADSAEDPDMVMCEVCDVMFNSQDDLKNHKQMHHDSTNISATSSSMENFNEVEPLLEVLEMNEDLNTDATASIPEKLFCDDCDKQFSSAKSLREHVLNKHGASFLKNAEYPKNCKLCEKVCTTGAAYKIHMQMHDRLNMSRSDKLKDEFPKKCEYCDKMCNSGAGLYIHTQMHERVTLGELKKKKVDKRKVELPEEPVIEESYHTCNRCFKVFATKSKLKEHLKSHTISNKANPKRNRKVLCDLCHLALDNYADLDKHKSEEHSEELQDELSSASDLDMDESTNNTDTIPAVMYACDICEDAFSSKTELKTHKETHVKAKSKAHVLICKYCKIYFNSANELAKHMHLEHDERVKANISKVKDNEKPFSCSICKKGFSTYAAMTTHSGWHKRSEPSANTPAATAAARMAKRQKAFRKIDAALELKAEPIDIPEFQCSTCLMELPNETALQIHVLEKHGNLDALMLVPRCDVCNKDFATQDEYETHKRFHDFLERQRQHERQMKTPIIQSVETVVEPAVESTSKRVSCSWCSSSFSRQDTLNTHIKQHHKEHVKTEFECNQCSRVFDKQSSLTIHLKMHQKQRSATVQFTTGGIGKTYVCSLCNMCFNYPKDLRMHTINAHPF